MNKPSNQAYPHDLDLGPRVQKEDLRVLIMSAPDNPIYRGLLQLLRDEMAACNRVNNSDPRLSGDVRSFYAGGAGQLEECFWDLVNLQFEERPVIDN